MFVHRKREAVLLPGWRSSGSAACACVRGQSVGCEDLVRAWARQGQQRIGPDRLDARKAELKQLRREVGRGAAMARIQAGPGPGDDAPAFTREQLAEAWGICE